MAKKVIAVPDEFASAMQQLSIEAEKTLPPGLITMVTETYDEPVSETAETGDLNERLDALEKKLFDKIDNLAAQLSSNGDVDLAGRFQKIDEASRLVTYTPAIPATISDFASLASAIDRYSKKDSPRRALEIVDR